MGKKLNLCGQQFGRLSVLKEAGKCPRGNYKWKCVCTCGQEPTVTGRSLTSGVAQSCGCLQREVASRLAEASLTKHGHAKTGAVTPEYRAWAGMINRCNNPNVERYKNYGGIGVSVCAQWQESFESFLQAMGVKPSPKYSLGRILDRGNYEPGNCFWMARPQSRHLLNVTTIPWQSGNIKSCNPIDNCESYCLRHSRDVSIAILRSPTLVRMPRNDHYSHS